MKFVFLCLLAVALLAPGRVQASPSLSWTSCRQHLSADLSHVVGQQCWQHAMPKEHRAPVGWNSWVRSLSPHVRIWIRFPTFAPVGSWQTYFITGYAVCDTPGRFMADGTSVDSVAGIYGAAATYLGYPGGLPFGTRVLIPSLHRVVTIHDRGALYGFMTPHLDIYAHNDCTIFGNLAGLGSHFERVFIYGG